MCLKPFFLVSSSHVLINCYGPNLEKGQGKTFKEILKHLANMNITPEYNSFVQGTGISFLMRQEILLAEKQY